MQSPSAAFKTRRNYSTVRKTLRRVQLYADGTLIRNITTDLDEDRGGCGPINRRIEAGLNQFEAAQVTICVKEPTTGNVYFKSDESGIFDAPNANKEYQVVVEVGLDDISGSPEYVQVFDGRVDMDTVERENRQEVSFITYGWLKNAERFNAEEIADEDNKPFKNITGISFVSIGGDHPKPGVRTLEHIVKSDDSHYFKYDGGEEKEVTADNSAFQLEDAYTESYIVLDVDFDQLPDDNQTDEFPVILDDAGDLVACYWYEHRTLEFIVGEIFDKLGITTQDISVREIETGLPKDFDYLQKLYVPNIDDSIEVQITACSLVDYDDVNNECTMLVGVRSRESSLVTDDRNYCYKIVVDVDNDTYTATRLSVCIDNDKYQYSKFMYFSGRWWALTQYPTECDTLLPNDPYRYWAYKIYRFDSGITTTDYVYEFENDAPSDKYSTDNDWDIRLAHSASCVQMSDNHFYMLAQSRSGGTYHLELYKYNWGGAALAESKIDDLRISGHIADIIADDYGISVELGDSDEHYFYGARPTSDIDDLQIVDYNITDDAYSYPKTYNAVHGGVYGAARTNTTPCELLRGILLLDVTANTDDELWIDDDGAVVAKNTWKQKVQDDQYEYSQRYITAWDYNSDRGNYYIRRMDGRTGLEYTENNALEPGFNISDSVPLSTEEYTAPDDYGYCGVCVDDDDKAVIPWLYIKEKLATVRVADFTGMTCREALQKLAEAYLCFFDIYEKTKARFYYRETNLGTDTLTNDEYRHTPSMRLWENWCDGVVIENKKKKYRWRYGNTDFNSTVIQIDNQFIARNIGDRIAQWMYDFFNQKRRYWTVKRKFYVEPELFDKITITFDDKDNSAFWSNVETMVYETSFDPSPSDDGTHDMTMGLLELTGDAANELIIVPVGHKFIAD